MTLSQSSAVIFGCEDTVLSTWERGFFGEAAPFGFILFSRNIRDAKQLQRLCKDLRDCVGWNAPIFIDQEGGRVARLMPPLALEWPPALDQMSALDLPQAERVMFLRARLIADDLMALGIDGNCTPLADIARPETHDILLNRCYGQSLERVAPLARANAMGCLAGGVLPVLKHIPGHGRATADSHLELPRVDTPLAELQETDFAAFKALGDLPLAMTAHVVYEALDARCAGTISPVVQKAIRADMQFSGALMTDDLSMQALPGSMEARAKACLAAGNDLLLHCNGNPLEMQDIMSETPRLAGASLARCEAALAMRHAPEAFERHDALAELMELTNTEA